MNPSNLENGLYQNMETLVLVRLEQDTKTGKTYLHHSPLNHRKGGRLEVLGSEDVEKYRLVEPESSGKLRPLQPILSGGGMAS